MKTEFMAAIAQLSAERNLPKEVILAALESALVSAYKKDIFTREQDISAKIDPNTGDIKVYIRKVVVESFIDPHQEISLDDARKVRDSIQVGEIVEVESTPRDAGRIAAQTARQVVLQRLREAEHRVIYEQFAGKEGEIVSGTIQFIQPKQIYVTLGKGEAILPFSEQVPNERYHVGQQFKFYLLEISQSVKGLQIIISRSHPNLLRRLFELEIPEIHSGVVELKAIAREAGHRSKVAVSTHQEGIEPVGCCLGPRGVRLQSIINELNGEKIDMIQWHADPKIFISNALSPAKVASTELNEAEKTATVVVPDRQLSLAIGKEGQNARLAARLSGWRIDIKSASTAEAERISLPEAAPQELETIAGEGEFPFTVPSEPQAAEPVSGGEVKELTTLLASEEFILASKAPSKRPEEKPQLRFAEDILPSRGKSIKLEKDKVKSKGHRKKKAHFKEDEPEE
ncbi:Transcription termination/antitermination protein NusA [subsurface metagenome]|nr:transcription termination/antitermination protein NusA [Dehalococcoidia bacterium]